MTEDAPIDPVDIFAQHTLRRAPHLACFDAGDYVALNSDLAEVQPLEHFSRYGVGEDRKTIAPERLTANLAQAVMLTRPAPLDAAAIETAYRDALSATPVVHVPPGAGAVDHILADRLVRAFDAVGVAAMVRNEAPQVGARGSILIRPDLLFPRGRHDQDGQAISAMSLIAVADTPRSASFRDLAPYLLGAGGVIAVEVETFALCREAQIPTVWLGGLFTAPDLEAAPDHPLIEGLGRAIRNAPAGLPWPDRPIDVLALEHTSPARANAWSRMADGMAQFRTIVHRPAAEAFEGAEVALRRYLSSRSKIVLHLHEDAPSALCAWMIEEVSAAGALLLSEPCPPHPLMKPDRHYFESSARRMPALVSRLIRTEEGRAAAVRAIEATRATLAPMLDAETAGLALLDLMRQAEANVL